MFDLTKPKQEDEKKKVLRMLDQHARSSVLTVKKKEDYPEKGLYPGLTQINARGIGMRKIDTRMLYLECLQVLDLSSNRITSIQPVSQSPSFSMCMFSFHLFSDLVEGFESGVEGVVLGWKSIETSSS